MLKDAYSILGLSLFGALIIMGAVQATTFVRTNVGTVAQVIHSSARMALSSPTPNSERNMASVFSHRSLEARLSQERGNVYTFDFSRVHELASAFTGTSQGQSKESAQIATMAATLLALMGTLYIVRLHF